MLRMKKISYLLIALFALMTVLSCFAQSPIISQQRAAMFTTAGNQDTTQIKNTRTSLQTLNGNTGGLFFEEYNNKWRVWNGSAWVNWNLFNRQGIDTAFWPLAGTGTFTNDVTIDVGSNSLLINGNGKQIDIANDANQLIIRNGVESDLTFYDGKIEMIADTMLIRADVENLAIGSGNGTTTIFGNKNPGTGIELTTSDEMLISPGTNLNIVTVAPTGDIALNAGDINSTASIAMRFDFPASGGFITTMPTTDNAITNIVGLTAGGGIRIRESSSLATSPGGANTQIQYNSSGSFAGNAGFVITPGSPAATTNRMSVIAPAGSSEGQILLTATNNAGGGSTFTIDGLTFGESSFQPALNYTFSNTSFLMSPITNGEFDITTSGATSNSLWNFGNGFSGASVEFRNGVAGTGDLLIIMNDLPTVCTGLATGTLWNNSGVLSICP